ncbi:hypothetical protein MP638_000305 [Amoeboaphelidium occidentale]|nr:hypothetical protein MP638_000305 [Amoeboaphelidium occidentale]
MDKVEEIWHLLLWKSWNNAYSTKFAKAFLWTDRIAENYREYKRNRKVKLSNYAVTEPYPRGSIEWLNSLTDKVISSLSRHGNVDLEQLKLISVNINACCKSGLTFHKDTITNDGYGDIVVNLILSGGGFIVFSESQSAKDKTFCLWLGPGDLYVISGASRFKFYHGVQTCGTQLKNVAKRVKEVLRVPYNPNETRMSITFRFYYDRQKKAGEIFDINLSIIMTTVPEGNNFEMRLLREAWAVTGGNWLLDNFDKYRENREEFISRIKRDKYRLNERRVVRDNGMQSFAGLQGAPSKSKEHQTKTSENKNLDKATTKTGFKEKIDIQDNTVNGEVRDDFFPVTWKDSTTESAVKPSFLDKNTLEILPHTPGTHYDDTNKRKLDDISAESLEYSCVKLKIQQDIGNTIIPENDSIETTATVKKLMKSIIDFECGSNDTVISHHELQCTSEEDPRLHFIEDIQLRKVLYWDTLVSSCTIETQQLVRKQAFYMLEVFYLSQHIAITRGCKLQEEMRTVFGLYAKINRVTDPSFVDVRVSLLTKHICSGKKISLIFDVLGGAKAVEKHIPSEFDWSLAYNLNNPELKSFLHQLKDHLNNLKTRKKDHEEQKMELAISTTNNLSAPLKSGEIVQRVDLDAVNLQEFGQEKSSDIPVVHGSANDVKPVLFTKQDSNHNLDLSANMEPSFNVEIINKDSDEENVEDGNIVKSPIVSSDALNDLKAPSGWLRSDIIETYLEHLAAQLSEEARKDISIILPFAQPIICNHNKTSFSMEKVRLYIEEGRKSKQHGGYRDIYQKDFKTRVFPVCQQPNDFDCGVHALINAEGVLRCISTCGKFDESSILESQSAADYRNSMIRFYDS